jgi:hypothetical protein
MENQTMTAKDKDNRKTGDEPRKPATPDELAGVTGVAGGSHDRGRSPRPIERNDLGQEDLDAAVGGCGSRERGRSGLTSDDLSDVAVGATRRTQDDRGEERRDAPAITGAE